ncbi:MAG: hypothetical protein ACRCXT_14590 [Paraclostridium sp.]
MFTYKTYGIILILFGIYNIVRYIILNNLKPNYISKMFNITQMKDYIKIQNNIILIISIILIFSGILFFKKDKLDPIETLTPYTVFILPYIYIWINKQFIKKKRNG